MGRAESTAGRPIFRGFIGTADLLLLTADTEVVVRRIRQVRADSNSPTLILSDTLAQLPDTRHGFVNLLLTPVGLGNDPCDAPPVARNNHRGAPLHFVQELGKMHFGFRGLNLAHRINRSIRPVLF